MDTFKNTQKSTVHLAWELITCCVECVSNKTLKTQQRQPKTSLGGMEPGMGTSGLSLFSPSEQCQQRPCNIRFTLGHHGVSNPCAVLRWPGTPSHTCERGVQEHVLRHSPSQMEPSLVPSRMISHVIRSSQSSCTELPSWFSGKLLTPNAAAGGSWLINKTKVQVPWEPVSQCPFLGAKLLPQDGGGRFLHAGVTLMTPQRWNLEMELKIKKKKKSAKIIQNYSHQTLVRKKTGVRWTEITLTPHGSTRKSCPTASV